MTRPGPAHAPAAAPRAVPLPGEGHGVRGTAVRAMFDRIAPRYDLLNRVMTLRVDQAWRRRLLADLAPRDGEALLDLCAGTMDVADLARRRAARAAAWSGPTSPSRCSTAAWRRPGCRPARPTPWPSPSTPPASTSPPSPSACATWSGTRSASPSWPGCSSPAAASASSSSSAPSRPGRGWSTGSTTGWRCRCWGGSSRPTRRPTATWSTRWSGSPPAPSSRRRRGAPASGTCAARPSSPASAGWSRRCAAMKLVVGRLRRLGRPLRQEAPRLPRRARAAPRRLGGPGLHHHRQAGLGPGDRRRRRSTRSRPGATTTSPPPSPPARRCTTPWWSSPARPARCRASPTACRWTWSAGPPTSCSRSAGAWCWCSARPPSRSSTPGP